jgi:undecaprenyl-diphosphatase
VAFAAATVAYPLLPPAAEGVALALAATVGVARIYVGAHLPLDVIGGAGLGLALGVSTALFSAYVVALGA